MTEKKSKLKTYLIRLIAVVALPVLLYVPIYYLQHFLCVPVKTDQTRILQFEKEPSKSIDVVMIGSSTTYTGFSSAYAYEKYGFTSYPYAISGSSCNMWKPAVMNILRTQKPKLVVVDVFGGGYDLKTILNRKAAIYMISEVMPLSPMKIKMALESAKNVDSGDVFSITFPIIRYHANIPSNIKTIKERLAIEEYGPSPMKGIEIITRSKKQKLIPEEAFTTEAIPLDAQTEDIINGFIDYCESKNIALLFVKLPYAPKYQEDFDANRRQNSVMELVSRRGCATLDLQHNFYDTGLNEKRDFYNRSHTNVIGQKKITDYIGSYISGSMGIGPSELDESVKADWDRAVEYYDAYCAMSEEMIDNGKVRILADSPELVERLEKYMKDHR